MAQKGGFNWNGISDNFDGSYTAKGKDEKRRLLKSLHSSGYAVRSKRNPNRSWTVTTVGEIRPTRRITRRNPVDGGYRPQIRANRAQEQGRYVPIGTRRMYHGVPRPGAPYRSNRPVYSGFRGPAPSPQSAIQRRKLFTDQGKPKAPGVLNTIIERNRAKQGQGPMSKQARVEESRKIEAEMAARSGNRTPSQKLKRERLEYQGVIKTKTELPPEPEPPKEGIYGVRKTTEIRSDKLQEERENSVT